MSAVEVDFDCRVSVNTRMDLVAFFKALPEPQRRFYWDLDIEEWGFDNEWDRPAAFVMSWLDDQVGGETAFGAGVVRSWTDNEWDSFFRWKREQYDALAAEVPWIDPSDPVTAEDLARMPGPNDIPLFGEA